MIRATRQIAQQISKQAKPSLRLVFMVMLGFLVVAVPHSSMRLAEAAIVELLPEDSESSQQEESGSQIFTVRTAHARWRLIACIPPVGLASSQTCEASYTEDQELSGWQRFAEKMRPMRC